MKKRKSSIISLGDFERVQEEDREEFEHKEDRKAVWCKRCGRKHGRREECKVLRLEKDLTRPPTKVDKGGNLIPNHKVGYYSTRPVEATK